MLLEEKQMTIEVLLKGKVTVVMKDTVVPFDNQPDQVLYEPIDWEGIAAHYAIQADEWREKICTIIDPASLMTGLVEVGWLTSYDILALRKGKISSPLANVAVMGLLLTSDNQIIIGLRGGDVTPETKLKFGRGLWNTVPAGQATWRPDYKYGLLEDTMSAEFSEEIGFSSSHIVEASQLGVYSVRDAILPGIKFAVRVQTDLTAEDIIEQHKRAITALDGHTTALLEKKQKHEFLRQAGYAPDAWEHSELRAIPNTRAGINKALKQFEWLESGQGVLQLHLASLD